MGGHKRLLQKMREHVPQGGGDPEGGVCRYIPTSSISLIHRSMPSKDQRLVMSYTRRIPCKGEVGMTRLRGWPDGRLSFLHGFPA